MRLSLALRAILDAVLRLSPVSGAVLKALELNWRLTWAILGFEAVSEANLRLLRASAAILETVVRLLEASCVPLSDPTLIGSFSSVLGTEN